MRSSADQFLQLGLRKAQIVRDTAEVGHRELVHLVQLSPMLQPIAESIRQPLDHGRGLIFNGHWKSSGRRKERAMMASLGGKVVAPDQRCIPSRAIDSATATIVAIATLVLT